MLVLAFLDWPLSVKEFIKDLYKVTLVARMLKNT